MITDPQNTLRFNRCQLHAACLLASFCAPPGAAAASCCATMSSSCAKSTTQTRVSVGSRCNLLACLFLFAQNASHGRAVRSAPAAIRWPVLCVLPVFFAFCLCASFRLFLFLLRVCFFSPNGPGSPTSRSFLQLGISAAGHFCSLSLIHISEPTRPY